MDKRDNDVESKHLSFTKPDVIRYGFQLTIVFIAVCVSLLNLTYQWGNQNLWTAILMVSFGYIMPNAKLKSGIEKFTFKKDTTEESF